MIIKKRTQKNISYNLWAVKQAINMFPSISSFAKAVGVSQPAASGWNAGIKRPSIDNAKNIEIITESKVKFNDIYPTLIL